LKKWRRTGKRSPKEGGGRGAGIRTGKTTRTADANEMQRVMPAQKEAATHPGGSRLGSAPEPLPHTFSLSKIISGVRVTDLTHKRFSIAMCPFNNESMSPFYYARVNLTMYVPI